MIKLFTPPVSRVPENAPPSEWLTVGKPILPAFPTTHDQLMVQEQLYEFTFLPALEEMISGTPLLRTIRQSPHGINYGKFMMWVMRDPARKSAYEEAQAIMAERLIDESLDAADGVDEMETLDRAKVRINTREKIVPKIAKEKYGEVKQANGGATVHVTVNRWGDASITDGVDTVVVER